MQKAAVTTSREDLPSISEIGACRRHLELSSGKGSRQFPSLLVPAQHPPDKVLTLLISFPALLIALHLLDVNLLTPEVPDKREGSWGGGALACKGPQLGWCSRCS